MREHKYSLLYDTTRLIGNYIFPPYWLFVGVMMASASRHHKKIKKIYGKQYTAFKDSMIGINRTSEC
jgi:hypothetical protein